MRFVAERCAFKSWFDVNSESTWNSDGRSLGISLTRVGPFGVPAADVQTSGVDALIAHATLQSSSVGNRDTLFKA